MVIVQTELIRCAEKFVHYLVVQNILILTYSNIQRGDDKYKLEYGQGIN